jgi:hypothetical protein
MKQEDNTLENPRDFTPTGPFEPGTTTLPSTAEKLGDFAIALSKDGVPIGYLNRNDNDWAVLSNAPLVLEQYMYNGATYYRVSSDEHRYMSVSRTAYAGFYNWLLASTFHLEGTHLVSDYNGQKLSLYSQDDGYLYFWDSYTVLDVRLEASSR